MKKLFILLFLFAMLFWGIASTAQNATPFTKIRITGNSTSSTATKVNVQEANGEINSIAKADLIDYLEFNSAINLPTTGLSNKIYCTRDDNKLYRWNGTIYVEVSFQDLSGKVNGNASITASTKAKITYDTKGLVTAGSDLIASDIPNIAQSQVTSLVTDLAGKANLNGSASEDFQVPTIPATANSATSKNYIDNALTGITWKNAVKVASTGNLSLSGTSNVDGTTIPTGTRILVKNQTDTTQNGIYISASGSWTRAADADSNEEIETSTVAVLNGAVNKNTQWTCTSTGISLGITAINYGQISGAGTYTSTYPIELTANAFSLNTSYANSLAPKANPTFTGSVVVPDATLSTQAVNLSQLNTAAKWSETSTNIRNSNVGDVELKINSSKQVSFLNSANTQVSRITDDGSYQIFGPGLIYGNGSGCRIGFGNNAFTFSSYAEGLGRYIFNPIYLNNTSGTVDIIGFQNKTVNPTSGNAVFNFLDIDPIVNQTGGANGITRGILINPTLTSAADFRALEITAGKVLLPSIQRTNGSGLYAEQDGTTLWHSTRWFTPTGTFSSSGTSVTTTGGQLTAGMIGSKIGVGTDRRVIIAFLTSNTCTVDSAFSTNYVNEPLANWGVYSRGITLDNLGRITTYLGLQDGGAPPGTAIASMGAGHFRTPFAFEVANNTLITAGMQVGSNGAISWSSTGLYSGTKDLGIGRSSAGVLEIGNGITAGATRDLRVRNVISPRPTYANDAAADADSTLPSGATYRITGSRIVYQKP